MADVEKLSIALTPDLATIVRQAVDSGEYASVSDVVRDALGDWQQKRALDPGSVEELRHLWREGLASGPAEPLDMAAIKREARERFDTADKHRR